MRSKVSTAAATVVSSAALVGGGIVAAAPAHALTGYLVSTDTRSACQAELNYAIKDMQASGQYAYAEPCLRLPTGNGTYVYQGIVYYRAR